MSIMFLYGTSCIIRDISSFVFDRVHASIEFCSSSMIVQFWFWIEHQHVHIHQAFGINILFFIDDRTVLVLERISARPHTSKLKYRNMIQNSSIYWNSICHIRTVVFKKNIYILPFFVRGKDEKEDFSVQIENTTRNLTPRESQNGPPTPRRLWRGWGHPPQCHPCVPKGTWRTREPNCRQAGSATCEARLVLLGNAAP